MPQPHFDDQTRPGEPTAMLHRILVALGLAILVLAASWTPLHGAADCGTLSYGFAGTRLLNDGISESAGPFLIDLPAGTYDVRLRSEDDHSTQDSQLGQEAEQWVVELDSGWVSGPALDLPDDSDTITTILMAQDIPASTTITVRHLGIGGINSINPVCVGFSPTDEGQNNPTTTTTTTSTTEAPPTTVTTTTIATTTTTPDTTTTTPPPGDTPRLAETGTDQPVMLFGLGLGLIFVGLISRAAARPRGTR